MNSRFLFSCRLCLALAAVVAVTPQLTQAREVTRLSGSYQVVEKSNAGPNTTVRLQIQLTNLGSARVSIQRIALRDFSHPTHDGVRPSALTIPAGGIAGSIQEFTVPRVEYEGWQSGNRPTIVLELSTASGRRTTEVLRLTRVSDRKGN